MEWIKCKNESEKLSVIAKYCEGNILELQHSIDWYEEEKNSPLDYHDEIHNAKVEMRRFEKILEIINADKNTSVLMY